ncbi:MAG: UDP-N-acetylmuramoyl-L-alanyl-D-glutamate--2,6-diaminopimelate ligase [Candidatus Marinimicrobia bacterium]|nr:UDP-N-acetylmuramoyl-L-alanyl-D-glutamate--2,6-diaminopimelate ligase [Candidatus Neomarinimicrobiota bacterium]
MTLQELVKNIPHKGRADNRKISAITYDSRKVKPGTLFVAISGIQADGHDFIPQAIENGAAAIISNGRSPKSSAVPVIQVKDPRSVLSHISADFYHNPSDNMYVVGVTGTNGKTSITHIIYHIFQQAELSCGTLGTLGFQSPSGMMSTGFTTPESVEVQQMLQTLNAAGVENVVMEISSHALELRRVDDVDVDVAVFTNLTPEHLDFHKNMDNYFQSKLKLFQSLPSGKLAVVNLDDAYGKQIGKHISAKVSTFGLDKRAKLHPVKYELSLDQTVALLRSGKVEFEICCPLIGSYNLSNILAATAVSLEKGVPPKIIQSALNTLPPVPGRMEKIEADCKGMVFIDYAHTPDAYEKLFKSVLELSGGEGAIKIVFGCGGDRDASKRPKMAAIAEQFANDIFVTNDNPRTENQTEIFSQILSGFSRDIHQVIPDRKEAIQTAMKSMRDDSILLILGKGRENFQMMGTEKVKYSDIESIKNFTNAD